jgi:hypothetical protein
MCEHRKRKPALDAVLIKNSDLKEDKKCLPQNTPPMAGLSGLGLCAWFATRILTLWRGLLQPR